MIKSELDTEELDTLSFLYIMKSLGYTLPLISLESLCIIQVTLETTYSINEIIASLRINHTD